MRIYLKDNWRNCLMTVRMRTKFYGFWFRVVSLCVSRKFVKNDFVPFSAPNFRVRLIHESDLYTNKYGNMEALNASIKMRLIKRHLHYTQQKLCS